MKLSEIFQETHKHLNSGRDGDFRTSYICHAIMEVAAIPGLDEERARKVIEKRIHPWHTLSGWLSAQGVATTTQPYLQRHRHAWLDLLVAEFKERGD